MAPRLGATERKNGVEHRRHRRRLRAKRRGSSFSVPASKDHFEIYLLMGQSNMVGRDPSKLGEQVDNPNIGALDGNGQWTIAREPMFNGLGIGPGIPFAKEMLRFQSNQVKIGLVPCAVGGTPLRKWVKGGNLYEKTLARAKVAMERGSLKGILWHQGESDSDSAETSSSYNARLTQMFSDLRADLGIPDLPIVVGQLGTFLQPKQHPYFSVVSAAIAKVGETVPNIGFANSDGLTDKGDHLHFDAQSQIKFGQRYAQAMRNLQTSPMTNK